MAIPRYLDPNAQDPNAYAAGLLGNVYQNGPQTGQVSASPIAPQGLLPAQTQSPGIMGRIAAGLANPAINQRLMAFGAEALANSGYQQTPVTTGAGLGRSLQAMNQAGLQYSQMIASQKAEEFNKRIKEAQLAKLQREAQGGSPSFGKGAGVGVNPKTNLPEIYQLSDVGSVVWTGVTPAETFTYQDTGSEVIGAGKYGGTGKSYEKTVSTDVAEKERQRIREEQRAPVVAAATEVAKAKASTAVEKEESATSAADALYELDRLDKALARVPQTKWAQLAEDIVAPVTGGDPEIQSAMGEVSQISGRMLKYVERLPGAATDKDRDVFMASAGVMQNPDATIAAKRAAVQSAAASYKRLADKYGSKHSAAKPDARQDLRSKYGL